MKDQHPIIVLYNLPEELHQFTDMMMNSKFMRSMRRHDIICFQNP